MTAWLLLFGLWVCIAGLLGCLWGWLRLQPFEAEPQARPRHLRLVDRPKPYDWQEVEAM